MEVLNEREEVKGDMRKRKKKRKKQGEQLNNKTNNCYLKVG